MHIVFLNPQGNFDKNDSYWTMHPDFGGQLVYVKEIAVEMAKLGHKVDIITRLVNDDEFPEFNQTFDYYEGVEGLRIIRIPCGPNEFLRKELLWEHLDEWTDNIISFYSKEETMFDFITSHYGDGGFSAVLLKNKLNKPFSFTGHSLGAQKFDKLFKKEGNISELENKYFFTNRIMAERYSILYSNIIFTSTKQEANEQYNHPLYKDITDSVNSNKFVIAPPGANTNVFAPYDGKNINMKNLDKIQAALERDISSNRLDLPLIVLASRLDPKKNHVGMFESYAANTELQKKSNLLVSLRGIKDAFKSYSSASVQEKEILNRIFEIIRNNDLLGKVCFVSIDSQLELADLYRYASIKKGVFTLTALYEPFGLAPIEAMSAGLPAVVTKYGGPSDVLFDGNQEYGVLIDVHKNEDISDGILKALNNYDFYKNQGMYRVSSTYTWKSTAKKYLSEIDKVLKKNITYNLKLFDFVTAWNKKDMKSDLLNDYIKNNML